MSTGLGSVDLVRMCGPISTSFSAAMALDDCQCGTIFLNESNSVLNAVSSKLQDDPEGDFSAESVALGRVYHKSAAAAGNISEGCESRFV